MLHGGVYLAVFSLPAHRCVQVGKLGRFWFRPSLYFYIGSAQGNLSARLGRHDRKGEALRWHIDYLSTKADMIAAIIAPDPRERECELAREMAALYAMAVPGFGASDCRCGGHLFHTPEL